MAESDEERLTRPNEDIGSSFCRAPELFDGPLDNVAPSADIYCLGKLLYWLAVGKGGRSGRLLREEFDRDDRNLVKIFKDRSYEHINSVLSKMITHDPAARYKNAGEAYAASNNAIGLFMKNYQPINRAPGRCQYCGRAAYQRRSGLVTSVEIDMRSNWHIFECQMCGHTLFFSKNERNKAW